VSAATDLITGVDFVCVPSADFDAALAFYGDVLGLERSSLWQRGDEPPAGAEFETGNMTIAVIGTEALGIEFSPNSVPVALQVDDVAAARGVLESRGVSFSGEIIDSGVCHMANFRDPEGNALMLHQRYAPFTRPAPRRAG
jgi:predicted enzyme related to lactoylglutathione lyase